MFIKGKSYIVKTITVNYVPSFIDGEENKGSLVVVDDSGGVFASYEVYKDVAEEVISKIANDLLVTSDYKNSVIDIEEIIENIKKKE